MNEVVSVEIAALGPKGVSSVESTAAAMLLAMRFQTTRYGANVFSLMLYIE